MPLYLMAELSRMSSVLTLGTAVICSIPISVVFARERVSWLH